MPLLAHILILRPVNTIYDAPVSDCLFKGPIT